jgi:hypothetical protein
MKEFAIIKDKTNEDNRFRRINGKLVFGETYMVLPENWFRIDEHNGEVMYYGGTNIPEWLSDKVSKLCPNSEEYDDEADDTFWIPESEIENLKKEATLGYFELADGVNEHGNDFIKIPKKYWYDVTNIHNAQNKWSYDDDLEKRWKYNRELRGRFNKVYNQLWEVSTDRKEELGITFITLYREPSTEGRYICIESTKPDFFLNITYFNKIEESEISSKTLEKVKLGDTFVLYTDNLDLDIDISDDDSVLVSKRNEYLNELHWMDEFIVG